MSTEYIERGAEPKPHYIDINAFLSSENVNNVYGDYWELKEKLEAIPAADVEPVVHEPCEFCGGEKTEYSDSAYGKFSILKDRLVGWCIAAEFSQCPPFADCSVKNMKLTHLRQIKHCPNCGRKLDLEEGK